MFVGHGGVDRAIMSVMKSDKGESLFLLLLVFFGIRFYKVGVSHWLLLIYSKINYYGIILGGGYILHSHALFALYVFIAHADNKQTVKNIIFNYYNNNLVYPVSFILWYRNANSGMITL